MVGVRIDNLRAEIATAPFFPLVVQMDVPVHHVSRFKFLQKPIKAFKTDMAGVFMVVNAARGSVSQHNIRKAPVSHPVKNEARRHQQQL